jgi:asparagine synthase (glutamine-hydrolysing)
MCGIAGFQGRQEAELLTAMMAIIAHRGPNGAGMWLSEPDRHGVRTGLGHRRLSIIDLSSGGAQPMAVVCQVCGAQTLSDIALTFNGEIYNFRELRRELEGAGHRFRSGSDSEVLLHLYASEGLEMMERLNGIFSFAIRDGRAQGRPAGMPYGGVLLARDQIGVKPLYLTQTPSGVAFASEIKALLQDPAVSRAVDPEALHQMLAYLWTPSPRTMLHGVRKVEPGQAMLLADGAIAREWTYYTPPFTGDRASVSVVTLRRELAEHLERAVARQLVADVPVGAFLSGGLDSSAIVAMMRRQMPDQRITCFTVDLGRGNVGEGMPDDLPFARRVAKHLDVDLVEVPVGPNAILRLPELIYALDEPQADPAPINALIIAEEARSRGIPVLLSGAGGDDLFGGYRRHWALMQERWWHWWPAPLRRGLEAMADRMASGDAIGQHYPAVRRASKMFAYAGLNDEERLASYLWWSTERLRRGLYTAEFASAVSAIETAAPMRRTLSRIPREHDPLQRMLMLEVTHFLADHNLNYTDRAGMAVGVEIRVPLLDLDLVSFATRVPSSLKQQGRLGKALFKQAMEPYLPTEVIYRSKTGFGAPLRRWLRQELRHVVGELLSPESIRRRGYFDPDAVTRLIRLDRDGAIDGSYTIFAMMSLELWFRTFLDQSTPRRVTL